MKDPIKIAQTVILIGFIVGLVIYYGRLAICFLRGKRFMEGSNIKVTVWLPNILIGSAMFVAVFWELYGVSTGQPAPVKLHFASLSFSGPSGPITLWVLVFLSIVFATRIIDK